MLQYFCTRGAVLVGFLLFARATTLGQPITRGDVNQDGQLDLSDLVGVLRTLYGSSPVPCVGAADANVDGQVDLSDAIELSRGVVMGSSRLLPATSVEATETEEEEDPCGDAPDLILREDEAAGGGGGLASLWDDRFDSAPKTGAGKYLITAPGGAIRQTTFAGRSSLMIQCTAGQQRDANGRIRSEIALWQSGKRARIFKKDPIGSERWYSFSIYIPNDWWYDDNKVHLLQWHGTEDKAERGFGRNPPLTLIAYRSELRIRQLWSARRIQTGNENRKDIWRGKIEKGKWMHFVFHMKWSYEKDGFLEVWKDGRQIIDQQDHPNCYNDAEGPYFNLGIYWPSALDRSEYSSSARHTVYYDSFKVGDGRNRLSDMAP